MLKKILLSFLASLIVLFSLAPYSSTFAQSTWYNTNPFEWYIKVFDENTSPPTEIFGERYTAAQVQWVFWSLFATVFNLPFTILGMPPTPAVFAAKFALGVVSDINDFFKATEQFLVAVTDKIIKLIASTDNGQYLGSNQPQYKNSVWKQIFLEDRPISGIGYLRNIGRKLKLVPEAKAADSFGFSRLTVIQDLWKITRNLAYFLFVILIIVISFMIMFKVKISPQAVITVQSALPKIVFTLILVTFSYAIAGFLIDLLYVVMGIFSIFLGPTFGGTKIVYLSITGGGFGHLAIVAYFTIFLVLYAIATLAAFVAAIVSLGGGGAIVTLLLGVFIIFLLIIFTIDIFKILFMLFKTLAGFYAAVILGPLQLSLGVLPQSQNSLGAWIKNLVSKLAVFPATGILFFLSLIFLISSIKVSLAAIVGGGVLENAVETFLTKINFPYYRLNLFGIDPDKLWGPPMLANGNSATSIAFIFMALGCIMIIPKVAKAIESALAGRPFDYEAAMSESTGTAKGIASSGFGYLQGQSEAMVKYPGLTRGQAQTYASRAGVAGFLRSVLGMR